MKRRFGALVCLPAGLVLGLGAYTFWYAEGGSYFSNDPRSCAAPRTS